MLVKANYINKKNSIYKCDLCCKRLNGETVNKLYSISNNKYKPIFDLCEKCLDKIRKRKKRV